MAEGSFTHLCSVPSHILIHILPFTQVGMHPVLRSLAEGEEVVDVSRRLAEGAGLDCEPMVLNEYTWLRLKVEAETS